MGLSTHRPEVVEHAEEKNWVIVGMYPRFQDEVGENAELVRRITGRPS